MLLSNGRHFICKKIIWHENSYLFLKPYFKNLKQKLWIS